uniref:Uncharacterized protein n=1 Tax=Meloidogyne enterolobii TaxID=390850 RepID=A0A6V7WKT8_MELEN|nr:unnamed protein product [Meloidogyne enterolobii]
MDLKFIKTLFVQTFKAYLTLNLSKNKLELNKFLNYNILFLFACIFNVIELFELENFIYISVIKFNDRTNIITD